MSITAEYDMRFNLAVTSLSDLESFESRYFYIMYLLLHCVQLWFLLKRKEGLKYSEIKIHS